MFEGTSAIRIVLHICNPLKDEPTINIIFSHCLCTYNCLAFMHGQKGPPKNPCLNEKFGLLWGHKEGKT